MSTPERNKHLADFLLARIAEDRLGAASRAPDPVRWWRECEAKQEIVTDFMRWDLMSRSGDMAAMGTAAGLRDACLRLAAIYKDHPDFDQVWLP